MASPSPVAPVETDELVAEFHRRWPNVADIFVSPVDGSPLRLEGSTIVDQAGHRFPLVEGSPILIPHLSRLVREHYAVCQAAGPAPSNLLDDGAALSEVTGFLFGRKLRLYDLVADHTDRAKQPAGTIEIADDKVFVWSTSGRFNARGFTYNRWHYDDAPISQAQDLLTYVRVRPPYFLLADQFPTDDLLMYYELLPYFNITEELWKTTALQRREQRGADGSKAESLVPAQAPGAHPSSRAPTSISAPIDFGDSSGAAEMTRDNVPFFRSVFSDLQLDVASGAVIDIGGGMGFLGAAMELAGAKKPISFDVRQSSLAAPVRIYPGCTRLVLAFADMFHWTFARHSCAFIAVRNNSPLCFAADLRSPKIQTFFRSCLDSLKDDGVLYATIMTNETGINTFGLSNRPIAEYVDGFEHSGLRVLRMGKLGSQAAFLCCKSAAYDKLAARMASARYARRAAAFREYRTGSNDKRVLLNFLLAVQDFAGEVALEAIRRRSTSIVVHGSGSIAYAFWRSLYVSYPRRPDSYIAPRWRRRSTIIHRPWELLNKLGRNPLRVMASDAFYEAALKGHRKSTFRTMDCFFIPAVARSEGSGHPAEGASMSAPDLPSDWVFPLIAGDLDPAISEGMAATYLSGRLRHIAATPASQDRSAEFESQFIEKFPGHYLGEDSQDRP